MSGRRRKRSAVVAAAGVLLLAGAPRAGLAAGVPLAGTQPADGSGDPAFPAFSDGDSAGTFDTPGFCSFCHAGYRAAGERIHEPFDSWAASMMALAGRDPLFWAALDIANQDDATLGDVGVGDFCLRCHAPTAWYEGRSHCETPWGEEFDGSCLEGATDQANGDFQGLSCHVCHRAYDAGRPAAGEFHDPAAPYGENGQLYLTETPGLMEGPYSDSNPPIHQARASDFLKSSAFCGQCHDVTNPARNRRDALTGADLGRRMPVERTWSEYRQSAFADEASPEAATCQSCHMPKADRDGDGSADAAYACVQRPGLRGDDTELEGPLRTHFFAGANGWMMGVLREELGAALGRDASFDAAIEASQALLRRTAEISVSAPDDVRAGGELEVAVRVTNLAGHKLPTGYPEGRRAWVRLAVGRDGDGNGRLSDGETVFTSGDYDALTAELERDAQLRLYEVKLGIFDDEAGRCEHADEAGAELFHFVLNDCVVSDGRIPPRGFRPDADTEPVGREYPEDPTRPGALAHWDDVTYRVAVPIEADGELLVEASLLYQSTSKDYVEFLRDASRSTCDPFDPDCDPTLPDARPNRGEKLHSLWAAYDRAAPAALATGTATVAVRPPGACCLADECRELSVAECLDLGGFPLPEADCAEGACAPCTADCDVDFHVTAEELDTLVDIALGRAELATCPVADGDESGSASVRDAVEAVLASLGRCGPPPGA